MVAQRCVLNGIGIARSGFPELRKGTIVALLAAALFAAACAGQDAAPTAAEILPRLREQVRQYAENAADYTCQIELERVQNRAGEPSKMEESARLEVAVIGGKERFAWPGESSFQDDEVRNMLVFGLSGTGSFIQHLRSVVLDAGTRFGEPRLESRTESEAGSRMLVLPWSAAASASGYLVNVEGKELEAATKGELVLTWPGLVLASFRLEAAELPVDFPAAAVGESIAFVPTDRGSGFRIPDEATQRLTERGGGEFTNTLRFRNCRTFQAESSVRFGADVEAAAAEQKAAGQAGSLPAGVPVDLKLSQAIEWGKNRTGDPIEGTLTRDIKWKGEVLAREGDVVRGRIVELKRYSGRSTGYLIGLRFTDILSKRQKGNRLYARMTMESLPDQPKGPRRGLAAMALGRDAALKMVTRVGPDGNSFRSGGFLQFAGEDLDLPAGFPMRWVVQE